MGGARHATNVQISLPGSGQRRTRALKPKRFGPVYVLMIRIRPSTALLGLLALMVRLAVAGDNGLAPEISAEQWLNGPAQRMAELRGSVVLVEFWTFGCWNCKNVEPYIQSWHSRYAGQGLVVLAVHTPEFDYEKRLSTVRAYVEQRGIGYPVAIDNDFSTWRAYGNRAWPSMYLVGRDGRIRYRHVGEGAYAETEAMIRSLLAEEGDNGAP